MARVIDGVDTVLLDIEGTICPISFVKETLFPYAVNALPDVLKQKWDEEDFQPYRDAFPDDAKASPEALEAHVKDLTAKDVKVAYLKNLQGYLWQAGYENRAYSTPLFEDVTPQLQSWKKSSLNISIYSSGSIFAQKLLFRHVKDTTSDNPKAIENLECLITEWFDTTNAGPKMEASSYTKIAKALDKQADTILFLSDNVKEVKAALEAGMKSLVVDRPGNAALTEQDRETYAIVESLNDIEVAKEPSLKRKADNIVQAAEAAPVTAAEDEGADTSSKKQKADE